MVFDADPVGNSIAVTLSWFSRKKMGELDLDFAWIYHWGMMNSWLAFDNLAFIFKVTAELNSSESIKGLFWLPYEAKKLKLLFTNFF